MEHLKILTLRKYLHYIASLVDSKIFYQRKQYPYKTDNNHPSIAA